MHAAGKGGFSDNVPHLTNGGSCSASALAVLPSPTATAWARAIAVVKSCTTCKQQAGRAREQTMVDKDADQTKAPAPAEVAAACSPSWLAYVASAGSDGPCHELIELGVHLLGAAGGGQEAEQRRSQQGCFPLCHSCRKM